MRTSRRTAPLALALLALAPLAPLGAQRAAARAAAARVVEVSPTGAVRTVTEGIRRVAPGGRVVVHAGVYREPTIRVDKPLRLEGVGRPVLDGQGKREILLVVADSVTVRGLVFRGVGVSEMEDMAALRVTDAGGCTLQDNVVEDGYFGIYLAHVDGCRVTGNVLRARHTSEAGSGNGIHLWTSRDVHIADNRISGYRDGIYFEFVRASRAERNVSERNIRYGLHFMYSDSCHYVRNEFRRNGSGVAVMYTKVVEMTGNTFADNWGAAAYGLLLKEIGDPVLRDNHFVRNTIALMSDGATRLVAEGNEFVANGWAVQLQANSQEVRFTRNDFVGNTFDVATNGRSPDAVFDGNYYDSYEGYDLRRDGVGDVPHRPVRLFSLVVAQSEPSLVLLRSFFVGLLDAAERVLPALTPETLADAHPAMRRRARGAP